MSNKAPALIEGMKILELLSTSESSVSFQQLEAASDMSRASVTRLLKVLSDAGYIESGKNLRDGYSLGIKFLYLLHSARGKLNYLDIIKSKLGALAEAVDASIQYGIYDRVTPQMTVICKGECEFSPSVGGAGYKLITGSHRHALGRVIMAFAPPAEQKRILDANIPGKNSEKTIMPGPRLDAELTKIKKTKIAFEDQECCAGRNRVAVPVFDSKGNIFGGVCASWFAEEFSQEVALAKVPKLREFAEFAQRIGQ